jgi:ankyrin repeat protein
MYKLNNLIQQLLDKGALIDQITSFGSTALHLACSVGNIDAVTLLLSKGADATLRDAAGMTAATIAASGGHLDILRLFDQQVASASASSGRSAHSSYSSLATDSISPEKPVHLQATERQSTRFLQEAFESLSGKSISCCCHT